MLRVNKELALNWSIDLK